MTLVGLIAIALLVFSGAHSSISLASQNVSGAPLCDPATGREFICEKTTWLFGLHIQGGPLLVISMVITPVNGLING